MISSHLIFKAEKCDKTKRSDCEYADDDAFNDFVEDVQIDMWVMQEKMDFLDRNGRPTFKYNDVLSTTILDGTKKIIEQDYVYVRLNKIETEDEFLQFGYYTFEGTFYDVGRNLKRPLHKIRKNMPDLLYMSRVWLMNESVLHARKIYGFIDLLGDLGGVTEVIMLVFGFFLFPVSEHTFMLQAIKRFYLAKTDSTELFQDMDTDK